MKLFLLLANGNKLDTNLVLINQYMDNYNAGKY